MGMTIDEIANKKGNRMTSQERTTLRELLKPRKPLEIAGEKIRWAIAHRGGRLLLHLAVRDLWFMTRSAVGRPGEKSPASIDVLDDRIMVWRWLTPQDRIKKTSCKMIYKDTDLNYIIMYTAIRAGKSKAEAQKILSSLKKQLYDQIAAYRKEGVFG